MRKTTMQHPHQLCARQRVRKTHSGLHREATVDFEPAVHRCEQEPRIGRPL
jgi:hypothetical protein